jgi:hypothetical protein
MKLGAPNYKKILPVVILIGTNRILISKKDFEAAEVKVQLGDIFGQQNLEGPRQQIVNSGDAQTPTDGINLAFNTPSAVTEGPMRSNQAFELPQPAETAPVSTEEICAIQEDIHQAAERKKTKSIKPSSPLRLSKRDREIFTLRNPELIRMAESMDLDYHAMSAEDQSALREIVTEQKALAEEIAQAAEREHSQTASAAKAAKKSRKVTESAESARKKRVAKKRTEFRYLLNNLEFTDSALDRLCEASDEQATVFLRELSHLNLGHFNPKCSVQNTSPKVTEQEAGRDGRIYYRPGLNGSPTVIELLGTKATQAVDIRALRNR